jgi:hypothetical protein
MFAQIFFAILAVFLLYIGVVEKSIINIAIGSVLIIVSAGRFYEAKTGSSFQEKFERWRKNSTSES